MYDTSIFKDIIKSSLNDSLVPLRNDVKTLVAQQNDIYNTIGLLLILIAIMAVAIGILFYKLAKQRNLQQEQSANSSEQITYALGEIIRLSEKDAKQNAKLSTLSEKLEAQAAQYDRKFIDLEDHLNPRIRAEKAINKAVDDLNS